MPANAQVLLQRLLAKARFRHLQVLVHLAELGSMKRTADAVGLSQPAVTQLLADLEGLLEVSLFHRHARGVLPTAVCHDLLPMARQCLGGLSASAEAVADHRSSGQGVVRLWASTAGINGLLYRAIPAFNQRHPAIQLHVREAEVQEQFRAISQLQADVGICREPEVVPGGWAFQPLLDDSFVVVCDPGHPLAKRRKLHWHDLAEAEWLVPPVDAAARHKLDELAQLWGHAPRQCQVITRVSFMTWAMLRARELLTLVPDSVFQPLAKAGLLHRLPLARPLPFKPLGMLLPVNELPAATLSLASFLRGFCAPRAGTALPAAQITSKKHRPTPATLHKTIQSRARR